MRFQSIGLLRNTLAGHYQGLILAAGIPAVLELLLPPLLSSDPRLLSEVPPLCNVFMCSALSIFFKQKPFLYSC